jgi:GNAT superfamily N-acetyltransferase
MADGARAKDGDSGYDIRVLATGGIEDLHAHLLRLDYLDRCLFFSAGNDDRAVDAHCLRLLASQAIVIGAYEAGRMRASVEIIPDRDARAGRATLIAEPDFQSDALAGALMRRARDEAGKHGLARLDFVGMTGSPQTLRDQIARFA